MMFLQMALAIGREGRTIEALHLWSQQNELADGLSRASEGVLTPSCLSGVSSSSPVQGPWNPFKQDAQAPLDNASSATGTANNTLQDVIKLAAQHNHRGRGNLTGSVR